ncbi:hypothetical protein DL98DRAFT_599091 [Cadophora sp. DSE1049]|nr:hypothetical protein DL98DRAFT_599091 [Cadophora sp. DSE1049]
MQRNCPNVTFHQWVARRIRFHDFVAHPLTVNPWTWTLKSDFENYMSEYLWHGREEFLNFRTRIRDTPTPPGMSAQHRELRDRRLMYGRSPEPSDDMRALHAILDSQILTNRHWQECMRDPQLMAGVPSEDVDALVVVQQAITHSCWVMLILDEFSLERCRELSPQATRQRDIMSRTQPIVNRNKLRALEVALQQAHRDLDNLYKERRQEVEIAIQYRRGLEGQHHQFIGHFVRRISDDGSEQ